MAIHHDERGWALAFPIKLADRFVKAVCANEDEFDELRDQMHEKYPIIDTFHTDCVTFQWAFDSMEEAKKTSNAITKDVRAWIKKQEDKNGN